MMHPSIVQYDSPLLSDIMDSVLGNEWTRELDADWIAPGRGMYSAFQ